MFITFVNGQSGGGVIPVSSFLWLDAISAGTYTYTAQIKTSAFQIGVSHAVLVAYEI